MAAPRVGISLKGSKQVQRNFLAMTVKMQKKIARKAVGAVASDLKKKTQQQITADKAVDTGLLRATMGKKTWTRRKNKDIVGATVGPHVGRGHFVIRKAKRSGGKAAKVRGRTSLRAFFGKGGKGRVVWADAAKYGHLVEGGTKPRRNKRGQDRGRVKPNRFMLKALTTNQSTLNNTFKVEIINGIETEAAKLPKTVKV